MVECSPVALRAKNKNKKKCRQFLNVRLGKLHTSCSFCAKITDNIFSWKSQFFRITQHNPRRWRISNNESVDAAIKVLGPTLLEVFVCFFPSVSHLECPAWRKIRHSALPAPAMEPSTERVWNARQQEKEEGQEEAQEEGRQRGQLEKKLKKPERLWVRALTSHSTFDCQNKSSFLAFFLHSLKPHYPPPQETVKAI